jgi:hypothetical protein
MADIQQEEAEKALAYKLPHAARIAGASVATLYRAAADGKLTIRKARGRSVILADELQAWLKSLPAMGAA